MKLAFDPFAVLPLLVVFCSLLLGLGWPQAWADPRVDIPQPLVSGRSDFISRSLKESCFSMSVANTALGRPCNPAFLALHQEERFFAHVFFGNNVDYVDEVLEVLDYEASTPTVQGLFSQSRDAEFEGDVELFYRKKAMSQV
ncbi:MAG: hypothetical protein ACK5Y2_06585 [Bdellovibrionales bacterium]